MFCPYCGTKLIDGASFCSKCGKKMPAEFLSPPVSEIPEQKIQSYSPNYTLKQLEQVIVLQLNTYRICQGAGCLSIGEVFYHDCAECTKNNLMENINVKEAKDVRLTAPDDLSPSGGYKLINEKQAISFVIINNYDINDAEALSGNLYHDCQILAGLIISKYSNKDENDGSYSFDNKDLKNVSLVADILGNILVVSLVFYGSLSNNY